jgi:hypothetical protein
LSEAIFALKNKKGLGPLLIKMIIRPYLYIVKKYKMQYFQCFLVFSRVVRGQIPRGKTAFFSAGYSLSPQIQETPLQA